MASTAESVQLIVTLFDRTEPIIELQQEQRASIIYAKQDTSAQLPVYTRLDPLELARDPLKVVAGRPRDILEILTSGSPVTVCIIHWTVNSRLLIHPTNAHLPPDVLFVQQLDLEMDLPATRLCTTHLWPREFQMRKLRDFVCIHHRLEENNNTKKQTFSLHRHHAVDWQSLRFPCSWCSIYFSNNDIYIPGNDYTKLET